jgi:tetratricopeptide (TPR) repeat protein
MQYKGSKKGLAEIAAELRVDAILEGTVERSGDRVRVTVHLDRASPEGQLWTSAYDRTVRDILSLQDEIARTVIDEIQVKLTPPERARLASARPVDPGAHDDYLRGQFLLYQDLESKVPPQEQVIKRNLQTAIRYFRQAIEKDPDYALAYARLAETYIALGSEYRASGLPKDTLPQAKAAAEKAVELDPSLGQAHFSLAQVLELYDWNWSEADKEYRLSLKLRSQ